MEKTLMLGKTECKRRSRWQRRRWLDSITNLMNINLSKLQEIVEDREAWHVAGFSVLHYLLEDREAWHVAVHGVAKKWTQFSD